MVKVKNTEAKVSVGKRTITVSNVSIEDGLLVDEDGSIAERIENVLPDGVTEFTLKIVIELPEDEE